MGVRARNALALIANLVVFISTCICIASFFLVGGSGNMQVAGWTAFRYFTVLSNAFAALGCLVGVGFNMAALVTGDEQVPYWFLLLKYAGTVAITVTLVVCLTFLGPIYGYELLFSGFNLFLHGVNPGLCILTFMFLERGTIRFRESWVPMVPIIAYGAVYVTKVVYTGVKAGGWPDFYHFNDTGMWPIYVLVIAVGAYVIAVIERLPHRPSRKEKRARQRAKAAEEAPAETTALAKAERPARSTEMAKSRKAKSGEMSEARKAAIARREAREAEQARAVEEARAAESAEFDEDAEVPAPDEEQGF